MTECPIRRWRCSSSSSLSGDPIAVYYNYAVFNVIAGVLDLVSGDITGATSRYIEDSYDDKVVAALSLGAHGDQNPIFFQQTFDLREIRIQDYAKRGQDISNAMPPSGGVGLDRKQPGRRQADEPAEADDCFDGPDAWRGSAPRHEGRNS